MIQDWTELYETDFLEWCRLHADYYWDEHSSRQRMEEVYWQTKQKAPAKLDLKAFSGRFSEMGIAARNKDRIKECAILIALLLRYQYSLWLDTHPKDKERIVEEIKAYRAKLHYPMVLSLSSGYMNVQLDGDRYVFLFRPLDKIYKDARIMAAFELNQKYETTAVNKLPEDCPYKIDQILGDFWNYTNWLPKLEKI